MPSPVLFGASGQPEPSPEIQRRLQAIHPRLFIEFMKHSGNMWGVYLTWASDHPSWEKVQKGLIPPDKARDRIGYLPLDCSSEEAPAYLSKMFRQYPREDVRNMVDGVVQYNTVGATQTALVDAIAEVLDMPDPSATRARSKRSRSK